MMKCCLFFSLVLLSASRWATTEAFSLKRTTSAIISVSSGIEKVSSRSRIITYFSGAEHDADVTDRRDMLKRGTKAAMGSLLLYSSPPVSPALAKAPKIKPDEAFANLVKAREELSVANNNFILKRDIDGLRQYLADDAVNINNYEENAGVLLASKSLDAESKVAIGTIRRYGAGADVIIMYGGLKGEIAEDVDADEINFGAVGKYMSKTMNSLDEVIAICRSNGF
mmetsp:Transcript_22379/g.48168  ORF Transcript_22379/g.48168 Transcript_22379/m.48168 type:complete len:226 (+) Transcript_22379:75-752(+)